MCPIFVNVAKTVAKISKLKLKEPKHLLPTPFECENSLETAKARIQSDQKIEQKMCPIFVNVAKTVAKILKVKLKEPNITSNSF